ncbi:CRTAC1 family protein [Tautonia marina]|uniref:CRTAC1 family protein n=1 Tax=Tautonia marina TaxID=2653855 RepID=UPI0012606454|nr:CRTAC1 family protein [Tautonia marina]
MRRSPRHIVPSLVGLGAVLAFYGLSRQPEPPGIEVERRAADFRFERSLLPELSGLPLRSVREVNPSVRHLPSMISFVGAAVSLADLDGDGLPNDLVHVDPRLDRVIVSPVPGSGQRFAPFTLDVAPLPYWPESTDPMGSLVGDFDEDGRADVLVYYWGRSPVLFLRAARQAGEEPAPLARDGFEAVELVEPHEVWNTSSVSRADLDGDGHPDLIIGQYFPDGVPVLDPDSDTPVELFHSLSHASNGGRNRLLLWERPSGGDGPRVRFAEAEGVLAPEVAHGWTFGIATADLDGDLLPEIYFVQDFGPDRLLHNRSRPGRLDFALLHGERSFTTPRSKVLGGDTFNGMGVDLADLNRDGRLDLVVSNICSEFGLQESNFAFLSTGEVGRMAEGVAPYRDESERLGLSRSGWAWGVKFGDFDNDAEPELLQANGFTRGTVSRWPELQEIALSNDQVIRYPGAWAAVEPGDDIAGDELNRFYVRIGDGYHDLARAVGLDEPTVSRDFATADVDGDGRLDFAVANNWEPSAFFRNVAPAPGAFLGLRLLLAVGPGERGPTAIEAGRSPTDRPGMPAIGAEATVHLPDGRSLFNRVDGGDGHSGQRAPELHFGLGRVDDATRLDVDLRWRGVDGRVHEETIRVQPGWHTVLLGGETNDD